MIMIISESMYESGYRVLRNVLSKDCLLDILELENRSSEDDWVTVFSSADDQDDYRHQRPVLSCPSLTNLEETIMGIILAINPKWVIRDGSWVFLRSVAGGYRQQIHRDYLHEEIIGISEESLPCGLIVSLQTGTKLATYGWNRLVAESHEEKIHTMNAGDIMIFRGDMIHCGMDYAATNIRMHCYLDVSDTTYMQNQTQLVHFASYRCPSCLRMFNDKHERTAHKHMCSDFKCIACDYHTRNKNTLRSHRRNKHRYLIV